MEQQSAKEHHHPDPGPASAALADLLSLAANLSAISAEIVADVAALQGSPQPAPAPQPQPAPAPAPAPAPQPPAPSSNIQWPSFTGTATFVGTSSDGMVNVYYDASLGQECLQNATDLLAEAPKIVAANNAIFGLTQKVPVNVIVFALGGATDGTGGADHMACDFINGGNIEVCASFGNSARVYALFEAELSENCMGGNLCGSSTGEALSRWCAITVGGDVLEDFASAPVWAQDGYANWVDQVEPTDQDYDSIGCGMAFLSWLMAKEGCTLSQIAQAMVKLGDNGTLAKLYETLKGASASPWATFEAAAKAVQITTDDPFGALAMHKAAKKPHPVRVYKTE